MPFFFCPSFLSFRILAKNVDDASVVGMGSTLLSCCCPSRKIQKIHCARDPILTLLDWRDSQTPTPLKKNPQCATMRNPGTALLLEHQQRHRSFYYTTNANHNQQQRKVELPFGKNASRRRSIPTIMYIWIGLFLLAARTGWQKTALLVHGFQAAAVVVSSNSRNLHSNNKNLVLASFFWPGGASARTAEPTKTRGGSFAKATNDDDDDDNEFSTSSTAAAATLRSVTFCNLPKDQGTAMMLSS